jgi:hypothetical protein
MKSNFNFEQIFVQKLAYDEVLILYLSDTSRLLTHLAYNETPTI